MKTNNPLHEEATICQSQASPFTDENASGLGSQAPCIGEDPHEVHPMGF